MTRRVVRIDRLVVDGGAGFDRTRFERAVRDALAGEDGAVRRRLPETVEDRAARAVTRAARGEPS
jgi:hypothetical protein